MDASCAMMMLPFTANYRAASVIVEKAASVSVTDIVHSSGEQNTSCQLPI